MSTTPFGSEQPTYSQPPAANTMPTMPTAPTMPTGPAATTASVITDDEKTAIRQGVFGALAYVSQADPGFFATFVESAAGAKALSAAPAAVQQLLSGGLVLPEASSAEEFRAQAIPRLQAAGLGRMTLAPAAARLVTLLEQMVASGPCQPERLLTLPLAEEERAYVVRLLTSPPSFASAEESESARQLGEELVAWLRSTLQKNAGAGLQQQILEASRLGQTDRVMELLRLKLETERKRTGC